MRTDRVDLLVAAWCIVIGVGFAANLARDLIGVPLLSVDLLVPAYALMLVAVIVGMMRPAQNEQQPRDVEGGTAHGG